MKEMTDDDFLKFLESYDKKLFEDEDGNLHKCYDSLEELSKSENFPFDSIIEDSLEMYGLDRIAKASDKWSKRSGRKKRNNSKPDLPKTTDAIYCKKGNGGKLELHLIEFKHVSLKDIFSRIDFFMLDNDIYFDDSLLSMLKDTVKRHCVGKIENSLQLKPYEALFIVLPELYDEYCQEEGEEKKDIMGYLNRMDKYYWVCIRSGSPNEDNLRKKARYFERYLKRMKPTIFKKVSVKTKRQFKVSLKDEIA